MFSEIQQSKSRLEATQAKIDLLKNEIASNEEKVQEYEENRHVIENLSVLLGEQKAVKTKVDEYLEDLIVSDYRNK